MNGTNNDGPGDGRDRSRLARTVPAAIAVAVGLVFLIWGVFEASNALPAMFLGVAIVGFGAVILAIDLARRSKPAATGARQPPGLVLAPRPVPTAPSQAVWAAAISAPPTPLIARSVKRGVEVTVDDTGITVKYWRARAGRPGGWATHQQLSWERIETLKFDSDWRDPAVALYATGWGAAPRERVVDSRKISDRSWGRLAARIDAFTNGRLDIDLSRRDDPGPERFS